MTEPRIQPTVAWALVIQPSGLPACGPDGRAHIFSEEQDARIALGEGAAPSNLRVIRVAIVDADFLRVEQTEEAQG